MKVSDPIEERGSLDFDIAHIILTFHQHHPMAPRRYAQGQGHGRGSYLTTPDASSNPHRRSVAIQDLLNPDNGGDDRGLRLTHEHNHYPGSSQRRRWSRESDSASSFYGSPRHRASPSSSGGRPSPPRERERRTFRPTYSEEEIDFIWYHRVDLGWEWNEILRAFNFQFPDRITREVGGIQCKYYRHLENNGLPQVRRRVRTASIEEYGMRAHTGRWYPWMQR